MNPGVKRHIRKVMNDKAFRYRLEKYWWDLNIPAVLYLFFYQRPFWDEISVLYLTIVSIYALVLTAGGAEQASEAVVAASED